MKFSEIIDQAIELLRRKGRLTYRSLKLEFSLDDEHLDVLKEEIIEGQKLAADEDGKVLVWVGHHRLESSVQRPAPEGTELTATVPTLDPRLSDPRHDTAERRQLTVVFCDLVGSTALSVQLDPEDYRVVVQGYQAAATAVIARHHGYLAQHWGDGLLVYFGYPTAHEDEARRAVRAALEIIATMREQVLSPLAGEGQGEGIKKKPLQVRIGIHTGLVVIGEIGSSEKRELLALGETPNIAARIQGLAEPNTVLVSAATQRLIDGYVESEPFGSHMLKGIETPVAVYQVQSERQGGSRLDNRATLTPLVGREQEVGLLQDRWEQTKEGQGQVILLSGEPGIGKSRLAYTLREQVTAEGSLVYEARCSPYHQQSALYPLIDVLQRTLLFTRQDSDEQKVAKLEQLLTLYEMQDSLPLFTALLSLPTPAQYPPLNVTPQKQKERTFQALLQLMTAQAERQATVSVWEDLHWADPSSLEFLSLLIEQIPTTKLLLVLTFRPEFTPPWKPRSHISQLVLNRLGKMHVETMIAEVTEGKELTAEVIDQIRLKTDGVPLFVEEVTKAVLEAGVVGARRAVPLQTIPATLQEALLARLDRLSDARQVAQLGATLGREFLYELLQAVAPISEADLQVALEKLVEAEILYQRGIGEQARYFFRHALIQDTAYQSLLKSTRLQYHQQIAQVLEERFPDIKTNQPELLAHHYTEANLIEQAIPYWQQVGEQAMQRSAHVEAAVHLTKGLELLKILPDTSARVHQELILQLSLATSLAASKGYGAAEVELPLSRAREFCLQVGEPFQIAQTVFGLFAFNCARGDLKAALSVGEQFLPVAHKQQDATLSLVVHAVMGMALVFLGKFAAAQEHCAQAFAFYNSERRHDLAFLMGQDLGLAALGWSAELLWYRGYPERALAEVRHALSLVQALSHPLSLAGALNQIASVHLLRREGQEAQALAEALLTLAHEHGLALWVGWGTGLRGWAFVEQAAPSGSQEQREAGLVQILDGVAAGRATGAEVWVPFFLGPLAQGYAHGGQRERGLQVIAEALDLAEKNEERWNEAELYRLKGELTLRAGEGEKREKGEEANLPNPNSQILDPDSEAEACFLKAIEVAQKQQAKSWELRAATSLARLWQQQGKRAAAHKLLSEVYTWFTEGFDTKDLQEAKALLAELDEEK